MHYTVINQKAEECRELAEYPGITEQQRELFVWMADVWAEFAERLKAKEIIGPVVLV